MKLLMTADAVGGVWTHAMELCAALAPAGVHVTLATMGPRPSPAQQLAARAIGNVDLIATDFALEWMDDPWADVERAGSWLLALEHAVRPDVVHLGGYALAALPFSAPVVIGAHSCVLSWWRAVKRQDPPDRLDRYRDAVRRGVHAADAVAAPTRAMLDAVAYHYGAPAHGVVVHNGRDSRRFSPSTKRPIVLSAGRVWDEAKNVEAVDRVAPALPWEVRIAGDPRAPDGSVRAVRHARALGPLTERALAAEMARASVFALPARYEPFGLSVLEAALSGCALVLGDIASLRELWDGAAVFVPPDDEPALALAINTLITDRAARARLAECARMRARTLTPHRMAAEYLALYRRLCGRHEPEVHACAS
jgi:glycosyltransferase involved in cell wall biosynthesis